jgi:lipopolysaccharide/colanic/teichoic acid biosynthesis glycosyltransferase
MEENEQKIKLVLDWLKKQEHYGLYLTGIMGKDNFLAKKIGVPFLGYPSDLADVIQTTKATSLIITGMPERRILSYAISVCENMAVRLSILQDLELHFGRPVIFQNIDGINFMRFRPEPLQNPFRSFTKRLLDIIISLAVVLVILPPITLLVWLVQLMQSPGPLFYRQERTGRGNTTFMINKFRSMHLGNHDPSKQATVNDPRIYPFGTFLRRTSLDELPQFLNALVGEMSVVGPRPHMPQHNELWKQAMGSYNIRSLVRPGITGLAQTRGYRGEVKTEEDVARRVECDIEYIEKWSLLLDISLITKTFLQIFRPRG